MSQFHIHIDHFMFFSFLFPRVHQPMIKPAALTRVGPDPKVRLTRAIPADQLYIIS